MPYGADRGPGMVYHLPWSESSLVTAGHDAAAPKPELPRTGSITQVPSISEDDTPLYAAAAILDPATPINPDVDDTPLFDSVPQPGDTRRHDERRLIHSFQSLPPLWQEVLWYICVEDISLTEASVHLRLGPDETGAVAEAALAGIRRAWIADCMDSEPRPTACLAVLWAICDGEDAHTREHLAACEPCADVMRRLTDVLVRAAQVFLPVALAQLDQDDATHHSFSPS